MVDNFASPRHMCPDASRHSAVLSLNADGCPRDGHINQSGRHFSCISSFLLSPTALEL